MKRGEIAPEEQFLLLSTIFSYLMLDFYVKTRTRFSLRDKRLFEITEVKITRVDCISFERTDTPLATVYRKKSNIEVLSIRKEQGGLESWELVNLTTGAPLCAIIFGLSGIFSDSITHGDLINSGDIYNPVITVRYIHIHRIFVTETEK